MAAPAPAPGGQRSADTVTLSGPPTAWRQTLQEALGERLQLQVGKGAEQAVIRLEPPMLGRVEIAIRHSAGSLEVNISATHGEVLRQLQTVSENLRSDLAQRQFTDVAVNVAPAPRGANATPQFAGDGSDRGRQQDGREQEHMPGNALAEANTGASSFSLNGRA
ncbi:flagellar hook-length control protein FliK [Massilia sp. Dwa41.01b]|nr:flagellar hook-length control protein FliK [Massilia sp. Dwa41.01b]